MALQDEHITEDVSIIEHYSLYYAMFSLLYGTGKSDANILSPTIDCLEKYQQDQTKHGCRKAFLTFMTTLTSGQLSTDTSS